MESVTEPRANARPLIDGNDRRATTFHSECTGPDECAAHQGAFQCQHTQASCWFHIGSSDDSKHSKPATSKVDPVTMATSDKPPIDPASKHRDPAMSPNRTSVGVRDRSQCDTVDAVEDHRPNPAGAPAQTGDPRQTMETGTTPAQRMPDAGRDTQKDSPLIRRAISIGSKSNALTSNNLGRTITANINN